MACESVESWVGGVGSLQELCSPRRGTLSRAKAPDAGASRMKKISKYRQGRKSCYLPRNISQILFKREKIRSCPKRRHRVRGCCGGWSCPRGGACWPFPPSFLLSDRGRREKPKTRKK